VVQSFFCTFPPPLIHARAYETQSVSTLSVATYARFLSALSFMREFPRESPLRVRLAGERALAPYFSPCVFLARTLFSSIV